MKSNIIPTLSSIGNYDKLAEGRPSVDFCSHRGLYSIEYGHNINVHRDLNSIEYRHSNNVHKSLYYIEYGHSVNVHRGLYSIEYGHSINVHKIGDWYDDSQTGWWENRNY